MLVYLYTAFGTPHHMHALLLDVIRSATGRNWLNYVYRKVIPTVQEVIIVEQEKKFKLFRICD